MYTTTGIPLGPCKPSEPATSCLSQHCKHHQRCQCCCCACRASQALGNTDLSSSSSESDSKDDDEEDDTGPMDPPVHMSFDIESMLDGERHIRNVLVAEGNTIPTHTFSVTPLREPLASTSSSIGWKVKSPTLPPYHHPSSQFPRVQRLQCQKINQLQNGGKILQLDTDKICVIKSMSFFQMPLSAFPKTLGRRNLPRGIFPTN